MNAHIHLRARSLTMTAESPSNDSVQAAIWKVIALLGELPVITTAGHRQEELEVCFNDLKSAQGEALAVTEEHVWTLWCDHSSEEAKVILADGIQFLSKGNLAQAEAIFDRLVAQYPAWAETWNKRATVYFLQNRDALSVADIFRTLELEPRHFGALGGFAQICMRNGAADAARQALLRLLEINPYANGVARAAAALSDDTPPVLH